MKHAQSLKEDLESFQRTTQPIRKDLDIMATLDIKNMYPTITYKLVKQAIHHYSKNFEEIDKVAIEIALDMLKFSITNCVCTWRDKYFRYGKETNPLL